ncbi:carbohydrate kinase [Streptomyces sp. AM 2-1-1]|uniref:carbohydrate kinase family protein n=1 Tax=Streptomyces sp. AM 2-1-1 TaxID=3028709 RepID=UPI0023BA16FD|nr:carbohydrate kinase [Streptomyces sp. AM 2-1-1]WEH38989.1 carbohydrate kinase [Streptomyces sp. AM 2-1-1]
MTSSAASPSPRTPRAPVTVIGEAVADAFVGATAPDGSTPLTVHPGGGPANTAVALARLGTPVRFAGRLSKGPLGTLLRERLAGSGVDLTRSVTSDRPATLALARIDEDGGASYDFYAEGTADWQWTADELTTALTAAPPSVCVHTGSLALALPPGCTAIEAALEHARRTATVCVDPNVRPTVVDVALVRSRLPHWCALADIVRVSADDVEFLMPGTGPDEAADRLLAAGAGLAVVTLGGDGALARTRDLDVRVRAPAVDVVDTIGAGDAFTAGLLHRLAADGVLGGRLEGLTASALRDATGFAVAVAARTCAVAGAQPPYAAEMERPG